MAEYGLIGARLGHSFSKEIHSMIAGYDYELIELAPQELKAFLTEKKFRAVNVTIPYKKDVIPFLDEITNEARSIGAVNCIRNDGGRLVGHNTDFDGLVALINHAGISVQGKKVLILGTGGTSDTAYAVCRALKAGEIIKVSRHNSCVSAISYDEACKRHEDAEIILNATPCGMYPDVFREPMNIDCFKRLSGVVDVIYNPLRTQLVSQGLSKGCKSEGGLYMLVAQAVKASEFFMSSEYEESLTDGIYKEMYAKKSNIVLTGMPASGKTTIGKLLACETGREFYDTDSLIVKGQGMSISDIFERYGEKTFRKLESDIIRELAVKSGAIIATGGGAVLNRENIDNLKMNGQIFFIDRSPKLLMPTPDRPTAFDRKEIMKRYRERYDIYTYTADHVIKNHDRAEDAAARILEELT